MERANLIVGRDMGECWKKIHPPDPLLDRWFEFSLQYRRRYAYCLLHARPVAELMMMTEWFDLSPALRDTGKTIFEPLFMDTCLYFT